MKLKHFSGQPWSDWYGYPCNCCGMTYKVPEAPLKQIRSAGKGIRVIAGEHGREKDSGVLRIKHVTTKNGVLTVVNKVL